MSKQVGIPALRHAARKIAVAGSLALALLASAIVTPQTARAADTGGTEAPIYAGITNGMPVVITELAVKTSNGKLNGESINIGEFVELTNVSTTDVHIADLQLTYNNVNWTPKAFEDAAANPDNATVNPTIPSHGSIVLWSNYANASNENMVPRLSTDADFNAYWKDKTGTDPQLVMGKTLFAIDKGEGMANSSARTLVLNDSATKSTNTVRYDDGGTQNDATLVYAYNDSGNATLTKGNTGTPGITVENQIPGQWPVPSTRTISLQETSQLPETVKDSQVVVLSVRAVASDSQSSIAKVRLWTKTQDSTALADSGLDGMRETSNNTWTFTVPAGQWTGLSSVSYSFVATDTDGISTSSAVKKLSLTATPADEYKTASTPLVITELAVDTPNVNGLDGYEFIEIYNTTNKTIDFSNNYTFYYNYPDLDDDSDVNWDPVQQNITIPAHKTAVFWIKNGGNDELTADDFNKQFGLTGGDALVQDASLFEINSGGMANNSARMLKITTLTKTLVSSASYPAQLSNSYTGDSHSVQYSYAGGDLVSKLARTDQNPTPGSVADGDIMAKPYEFPADVAAPTIKNNTANSFAANTDVPISFEATSAGGSIHRATVYYRLGGESSFTRVNLLKTPGSDTYTFTLNKIDLIQKQKIEYYIEISDGINSVVRTENAAIANESYDNSAMKINLAEKQFVSGIIPLRATTPEPSSTAQTSLSIDGKLVSDNQLTQSLQTEPFIAAEVTQTDIFFLNSFTKKLVISGTPTGEDWKNNVIGAFDDGTYGKTQTVSYPAPLELIHNVNGKRVLSLYMNSGTKSSPTDMVDDSGTVNTENSDNYLASHIRLILPNGKRLSPSKAIAGVSPGESGTVSEKDVTGEIASPNAVVKMGDSEGQYEYLHLEFEIGDDDMLSKQYLWNTAETNDGSHEIRAESGTANKTVNVIVDNTKPEITSQISADATQNQVLRGKIEVNAQASDATSGVQGGVTATLSSADGKPSTITLPYETSSAALPAGVHTISFRASDNAGNTTEKTVSFTTAVEKPSIVKQESIIDSSANKPKLSVTLKGQEGDSLNVDFKRGEQVRADSDAITIREGSTQISGLSRGTQGTEISAEQAKAAASQDSASVTTTGTNGAFPYQSFDVKVPQYIAQDAQATTTIRWNGKASAGDYVYAFVNNAQTGAWDEIARVRASVTDGTVSIERNIANAQHIVKVNGSDVIRVVIQTEAGFAPSTGGRSEQANGSSLNDAQNAAGGTRSTSADTGVTDSVNKVFTASSKPVLQTADDSQKISQDDAPRSDYDFTLAWESDTQYYNANYDNDGYYHHQANIHDWLLANRDRMNIQYLFHTGDIVDNAEIPDQWTRADEQYKKLDDAGMPYGVLAGNHDVDHKSENYTNYYQHFGQQRYSGNPWYGGSYENNRGHYDLLSAGGINFIMVYMGWGVGDEQIDWMNQVLAQYPDRVAILDFHEYLLASGGLGLQPQEIYKRVVIPNKNVKMVMSGHYHSAQKTVSAIDSDGDGKPDRNVVNMLFDYQSLDEGGMGFIRLMHVNTKEGTMRVRTYSPSLKEYGSQAVASSTFKPSDEEFTIDLTQLGIVPVTQTNTEKMLSTDAVTVDLLSDQSIGSTQVKLLQGENSQLHNMGATFKSNGVASDSTVSDSTVSDSTVLDSTDAASHGTAMASFVWASAPSMDAGWYAVAKNAFGGEVTSMVQYVGSKNGSDNGGNAGGNSGNSGNSGNGNASENNAQNSASQSTESHSLANSGSGIVAIVIVFALSAAVGITLLFKRFHRV